MGIRIKRGELVLPPVRIVVTGSSSEEAFGRWRQQVFKVIDEYRKKYQKALWITGACVGVDEWVALHLHSYGETVYTVVPADKDHIDKKYRQHCSAYEIMPKSCGNTKSERYMARNHRMVDISMTTETYEEPHEAICLAFPDKPETNRDGTWATVRKARRAGMKKIKETLLV